jgi:serine/threonine protein kinase
MSSSANETETFQHYQVAKRGDGTLWELGRGAMGITYKAFDTNLRCDVALKVINALHLDSDTARARFQREARAAAGLRHRNVATVYHLGNDDQSFFYAMEYVDGETVESLVKKRGPLPPADALQIVVQVARALGSAARQNLVHRDIKPANIMVVHEDEDEDQYIVKVIDFGLARPALGGEGSAHITMGGFVGTPQYASPEQLEEKDLDARSDIYSLGITLWYMLAARPPFTGPLGSVFIQQLTKEPPWEQLGDMPEPVRKLLAHMLQKDPAARQQSPVELRREIETCLKKLSTAGDQAGAVTPADHDGLMAETAVADTATATSANTDIADTGVDIEPVIPTPDLEIASSTARTAVLTIGSLLGGRYELAKLVGEGNNGRVFHAFDVERSRAPVAIKILHSDVLATTAERRRFEGDLSKLRLAPHPNLLEVYGLEEAGDTNFLVSEWVNGFTLVDLLRSRGQLPLRETIRLLAQAVTAADHARAHDLPRIELGLHQILAHFPTLSSEGDADTGAKTALARPLDQWPDFALKIDALGITREAGDSMTWAGDMTMMPAAPVLGRDTQTSIRGLIEGSDLFAIGLLTYELLDGAPPAVNQRDGGREARYVALSALNEPANAILRRALSPNPGFASNKEFFEALLKVSGLTMAWLAASTAPMVTAPPAAASETPETSTPSETFILDEPPASKTTAPAEDESASTMLLGDGESISAPVADPRDSTAEITALRDRPLGSASATGSTVAPPEPEPFETPEKEANLEDGAQTVLLDSTSFVTPPEAVEPSIAAAKAPESPLADASSSQTRPPEMPSPAVESWIQARDDASVSTPVPAEETPEVADFRVEKEASPVEGVASQLTEPLPPTKFPTEASIEEAVAPMEPARMDRADVSLDYPSTPSVPATSPVEEEVPIPDWRESLQKELAVEKSKPPVVVSRTQPVTAPDFVQPEPEPQGSSKLLLIVGAVAAMLIVGGLVAFLATRGNHSPAKPPVVVVRSTPVLEEKHLPLSTPAPTVAVAETIVSQPPPQAPTVEPKSEPPAPTDSNEGKAASSNPVSPVPMPAPMVVEPIAADTTRPPAPSPTPAANRPNDRDNNDRDENDRPSKPRRVVEKPVRNEPASTPARVAARERENRQSAPPEREKPARKDPPKVVERTPPKPVVERKPDKPSSTPAPRDRGPGVSFMR